MTFGNRLKRARERAGLTQKQLEEASGVSQKTISKIERGDQPVSTAMVQLATACGVRPEWLADAALPMVAPPPQVAQPKVEYNSLTAEQVDLARVWAKLPADRQTAFHDMIFFEAAVFAVYPWLRSLHPTSASYQEFEDHIRQDMLKLRPNSTHKK